VNALFEHGQERKMGKKGKKPSQGTKDYSQSPITKGTWRHRELEKNKKVKLGKMHHRKVKSKRKCMASVTIVRIALAIITDVGTPVKDEKEEKRRT